MDERFELAMPQPVPDLPGLPESTESVLRATFNNITDFTNDILVEKKKLIELSANLKMTTQSVHNWLHTELYEQINTLQAVLMRKYREGKIWREDDVRDFPKINRTNLSLMKLLLKMFREKEVRFLKKIDVLKSVCEIQSFFDCPTAADARILLKQIDEKMKQSGVFPDVRKIRYFRRAVQKAIGEEIPNPIDRKIYFNYDLYMKSRWRLPNKSLFDWRTSLLEEMYMRTKKPTVEQIKQMSLLLNYDFKTCAEKEIFQYIRRRSKYDKHIGWERKENTPESEVRFEKAWMNFGNKLSTRRQLSLFQPGLLEWAGLTKEKAQSLVDKWSANDRIIHGKMIENIWVDWRCEGRLCPDEWEDREEKALEDNGRQISDARTEKANGRLCARIQLLELDDQDEDDDGQKSDYDCSIHCRRESECSDYQDLEGFDDSNVVGDNDEEPVNPRNVCPTSDDEPSAKRPKNTPQ